MNQPASAQPLVHRGRVRRISGDSRVATSVAVSRALFTEGTRTVVLVSAGAFPDALAAVPLAAREQAALLLVEERVAELTRQEITRLGATRAVLVGAHGVVPVAAEMDLVRAGLDCERLAGDGRFHTAAIVARTLGAGPQAEVLVASGTTFADALPAGPLAALAGAPVLLTNAGELPADTTAVLSELAVARTVVVGGRAAVSETVRRALPDARRVAGRDRYATSVAAAQELLARGGSVETVVITSAHDFADALSAGPYAAHVSGPLLLVDGRDAANAEPVYAFLSVHRDQIGQAVLVGGHEALSGAVEDRIAAALEQGA